MPERRQVMSGKQLADVLQELAVHYRVKFPDQQYVLSTDREPCYTYREYSPCTGELLTESVVAGLLSLTIEERGNP